MPPDGRRASVTLTLLALSMASAACSSGSSSGSQAGSVTTTSSTNPTSAPEGSTTSLPFVTTTTSNLPVLGSTSVQAQIVGSTVVITIGTHVSDLAARVGNARLVTTTEFDMDLAGIEVTAPSQVTSASGQVSSVAITQSASDTHVRVLLRTPASGFEPAVGGGTQVQVTFS
ncbi:MAG TPA: hypothetical protein VEI83_15045 [Acidimicrobiales bacterium]|nr:hypothetical protein [Acidimicrobiales bacterium]